MVVNDDQLSLAIGKRGQNVRLAARLTGWDVDILTPAEFQAGVQRLDLTLKSVEGVTQEMVDKLIALGLIDVRDIEEVGVGPLMAELGLDERDGRRRSSSDARGGGEDRGGGAGGRASRRKPWPRRRRPAPKLRRPTNPSVPSTLCWASALPPRRLPRPMAPTALRPCPGPWKGAPGAELPREVTVHSEQPGGGRARRAVEWRRKRCNGIGGGRRSDIRRTDDESADVESIGGRNSEVPPGIGRGRAEVKQDRHGGTV